MTKDISPRQNLQDARDMIRDHPRLHGEIGLWLIVIFDAFETILRNGCHNYEATNFLLEENIIFNAIALALEYEDPDTLRQWIRNSLSKKRFEASKRGSGTS